MRNCGFEFPHGPGVTINLAPADVRQGRLDLRLAYGPWPGRLYGAFLRQAFMFLGELSRVRGTLSAALAAREFGIKAITVPESNAREAAIVEGVGVFALKSLPQAVDLVNALNRFSRFTWMPACSWPKLPSTALICATCAVNRPPSARWKSPAQVDTTSCSSAHQAQARPWWPNVFPSYCRQCPWAKPSRPHAFIT
jgi:Subunit ChlI of Mg-chelatase